jgi:DUF4097 and DUF4098 domain-containing protein YvlB
MRRRSLTGPLMLLIIGCLFLWRNLHPEFQVFDLIAQFWPFILIGWGLLRLLEVVLTDDERWRGGLTGGEVVLVILICCIGLGIWNAKQYGIHFNSGSLQWFGDQFDYPVSINGPAAGMKRVVFENPRGNIKVIGGDGDTVSVSGRKYIRSYSRVKSDRTNNITPVELVPQGDRLLIRTNQDRAPDDQRVSDDLEVTVPRSMAVEVRGGNTNDFEVSDVNGDVELTSNRGDARLTRIGGAAKIDIGHSDVIRVSDVKGKIDLQGRGSDVDLENIGGQVTISGAYGGTLEFKNLAKPLQFEGERGTQLNVQAVPGRIAMDRGELTGSGVTGPVKLTTGARDIRLEQFTQSLDMESVHGDVSLAPAMPMPSIDVRSGNGKIELIVPPKATFHLEASAERGEAYNGYGAPLEQHSEGRSATIRGNVGDGPAVHLTARRGSIQVRKEGQAPSEEFSDEQQAPKPPKPPNPPKAPKPDSEIKM